MTSRLENRRTKKPWLALSGLLAMVLAFSLAEVVLPSKHLEAQGTTVEIRSAIVGVGSSSSVDIWVRNYPSVPDVTPYGLGAYTIRIDFDPLMINVTGVSPGDPPFGSPVYHVYANYVSITHFHTDVPGPGGNVRLCDLEFTCLAEGETTLALTVEILADVNGEPVEHVTADGTITQTLYEAETAIAEEQDLDGVVVIPVTVLRVKNPITHETIRGIAIADYIANMTFTPGFMEILDIRGGDPPFATIDPANTTIDNVAGTASVSADVGSGGIGPPVIIFRIVARLTNSTLISDNLSVKVIKVSNSYGKVLGVQNQPMVLTFQRGDIQTPNDSNVDIKDAMFGAQYVAGFRAAEDIGQLNMASIKHDGSGDIIDIKDCMFIAQYVVGIRDEYFNPVP